MLDQAKYKNDLYTHVYDIRKNDLFCERNHLLYIFIYSKPFSYKNRDVDNSKVKQSQIYDARLCTSNHEKTS